MLAGDQLWPWAGDERRCMCSGRLGSCYSRGLSFFRNEGVRCIKGKPCPAQVSASALTLCTDSVSDSRAFRPTRCCALPSPSPPAPPHPCSAAPGPPFSFGTCASTPYGGVLRKCYLVLGRSLEALPYQRKGPKVSFISVGERGELGPEGQMRGHQ